jgi:hypothetical protein
MAEPMKDNRDKRKDEEDTAEYEIFKSYKRKCCPFRKRNWTRGGRSTSGNGKRSGLAKRAWQANR